MRGNVERTLMPKEGRGEGIFICVNIKLAEGRTERQRDEGETEIAVFDLAPAPAERNIEGLLE